MGDLMRVKMLAAWAVLGLAPALLGALPAEAASTRDRRETHRPAEATPARRAAPQPARQTSTAAPQPARQTSTAAPPARQGSTAAQRPASASQAAAHRAAGHPAAQGGTASRLPRLVGSAQASMAAPMRGQLAVSRDRHAAVSNAQSCRTSAGRRSSCARGPAMSWTRGLEPAAGIQSQECPDGTMATMARGHDNIVRCMPI